jgi:glycosyltransferase involved in cell wall biosynthesis
MKISIVTPSFNQGAFIERTLQSVAEQSGADIEHVVFDGGSRDQTVDILKRWTGRVRWTSAPDKGQTDAVNKGIRATDGQIIGWLNSDDVYYPDTVQAVVDYFESHPDVDVVYGKADHIDLEDRPFEEYPTTDWDFERLMQTCFICQPALFMRRRVIDRLGVLDESLNYCMDYEYWLRLGQAGVRFGYLERKLAGSRLYADNKTLGARVKVHAEINRMFVKRFGKVPDRWLYNYAHAVVERRIDRQAQPTRFGVEVGIRSLLAAMRWNKGISTEMRNMVAEWIRHA